MTATLSFIMSYALPSHVTKNKQGCLGAITCSFSKSNPIQAMLCDVATASSVASVEVGVAGSPAYRGCDTANRNPCGILPPNPMLPRVAPMHHLTAKLLPLKQGPTFRRSACWLPSDLVHWLLLAPETLGAPDFRLVPADSGLEGFHEHARKIV